MDIAYLALILALFGLVGLMAAFESGTPFTDFLHIAALLLPFSFPFLYGRMLGRLREGLAILGALLILIGVG